MKKLILSLLLAFPIFANAYDAVVDGIYYNLNSEEKVAEVTKAKDGYRGNVNIPPTITYNGVKYTVNSIGNEAFILCGDLTSVTIPNTVTNIGERAFLHCKRLTNINIPSSVVSIKKGAFWGTAIVNNSPDGVVYLDNWAIWHKGPMPSSITFQEGTVGIAGEIFEQEHTLDYSNLKQITMPNSVKYIGNGAFRKLYIESLTLSNSLEVIEDRAFDDCRHFTFTSLAIPNTVKVIGKHAFSGCNFQNLTIGNSVEYIGNFAFSFCKSLTNLTIPNSVIFIGYYAFDDCTSLKSVTLGNVDLIDEGAFKHCNALTTVTFPKDPIIFGDEVFFDTAIDPNSMSWPAPTHKSDWMVVDDQGNKVKKIKWGMKDCYAYWLKNEKVYFGGVGEDILNIGEYLNYEDLEAAIFFKIYCDKLRTRGKNVNNNNSNSNNKSTGKSTGKATGKSTGKATGKTNTVRKRR